MMLRRLRVTGTRWGTAAAACVIALAACESDVEAPVATGDLLEMEADNVVFGMRSFLTTSGVREGRVDADTAFVFADSSKIKLRQMEVVFYDPDGRARATVTGVRGEWDRDTDRMVARGDVVLLVHHDGQRIESPEIHYDPNADRIWSDSTTVQTMSDGTVTRGSAFESDLEFTNVRILDIRGGARRIF